MRPSRKNCVSDGDSNVTAAAAFFSFLIFLLCCGSNALLIRHMDVAFADQTLTKELFKRRRLECYRSSRFMLVFDLLSVQWQQLIFVSAHGRVAIAE